jgi:hypothetical protein
MSLISMRFADWLQLAAAPTFAAMALLTVVGDAEGTPLCSVAHASPLSGMAVMYLLMSAFHAAPWLRRIAGWKRQLSQPGVVVA